MDHDRFVRQSDLGKEFSLTVGETQVIPEGDFSYQSEGGVDVKVGAGAKGADPGSTLIKAGTDVTVTFLRQNAILLDLVDCTAHRIEDQLTLGRQILDLWREGKWKPEMCTVVELVEAKSTTAIISSGSSGGVSLRTSADATVAGTISLADAHLGLQLVSSKNIGSKWIATPNATPLIRALRLKRSLWSRDPKVVVEGLDAFDERESLGEEDHDSHFDLLGED
jgi:hypothetical protein